MKLVFISALLSATSLYSMNEELLRSFHNAIACNNTAFVSAVVKKFPEIVHKRDTCNNTALHIAAEESSAKMVELLITEGKADIEARNNWNNTPLMSAVICSNKKAIEPLLEHGADMYTRDGLEESMPLSHAIERDVTEIAKTLLCAGASRDTVEEIWKPKSDEMRDLLQKFQGPALPLSKEEYEKAQKEHEKLEKLRKRSLSSRRNKE